MKIRLLAVPLFLMTMIILPSWLTAPGPGDKANLMAGKKYSWPDSVSTVKITAVGDFLMHLPVINSAYDTATQTYNFKPVFQPVAEYLSSADITIGNLETRLAGKERGYSGYPCFNCPADLAYDLKDLGADIITVGNNHSLDMGMSGLSATLDNLDRAGLEHIGNARNQEERDQLLIKEINNIKLGFLNYTETTNGIPIPPGKEYAVNMLNLNSIKQDISSLREQQVDLVVVCLHFGTEYMRQPTEEQKKTARQVFAAGADIILGDHVHVLQPMEKVGSKFIIYSLGNFISNQRWQYSDTGVILNLIIEKNLLNGKTSIQNVSYIPVWVDTFTAGGKLRYRVLPVEKALDDYQKGRDPLLTNEDNTRLKQVWEETTTLLSRPDQEIMPVMLLEKKPA